MAAIRVCSYAKPILRRLAQYVLDQQRIDECRRRESETIAEDQRADRCDKRASEHAKHSLARHRRRSAALLRAEEGIHFVAVRCLELGPIGIECIAVETFAASAHLLGDDFDLLSLLRLRGLYSCHELYKIPVCCS